MLSAATTSAAECSVVHGSSLIPVSQLLRFERCRGFATTSHPHGRPDASCIHGSGRLSCRDLSTKIFRPSCITGLRSDAALIPNPSKSRRSLHNSSPRNAFFRSLKDAVKEFYQDIKNDAVAEERPAQAEVWRLNDPRNERTSSNDSDHELDELIAQAFRDLGARRLTLDKISEYIKTQDSRYSDAPDWLKRALANRLNASTEIRRQFVTSKGRKESVYAIGQAKLKSRARSSSQETTAPTAVRKAAKAPEPAVAKSPFRTLPTPFPARAPTIPQAQESMGIDKLIEALERNVAICARASQSLADKTRHMRQRIQQQRALHIEQAHDRFRAKLRLRDEQLDALQSRMDALLSQPQGIPKSSRYAVEDIPFLVRCHLWNAAYKPVSKAVDDLELLHQRIRKDVNELIKEQLRHLQSRAIRTQQWSANFKIEAHSTTMKMLDLTMDMRDGLDDIRNRVLSRGFQKMISRAPNARVWGLSLRLIVRYMMDDFKAFEYEAHLLRQLVHSATQASLDPLIFGHKRHLLSLEYDIAQSLFVFTADVYALRRLVESRQNLQSRIGREKCRNKPPLKILLHKLFIWETSYRDLVYQSVQLFKLIRADGLSKARSPLEHYLASIFRSFTAYHVTNAALSNLVFRTARQSPGSRRSPQLHDAEISPTNHHHVQQGDEEIDLIAEDSDPVQESSNKHSLEPAHAYGSLKGVENWHRWVKHRQRDFLAAINDATREVGLTILRKQKYYGRTPSPRPSKRLLEIEGNLLGYVPTVPPAQGIRGMLKWPKMGNFYPNAQPIPVEYVFSAPCLHNALQKFQKSRVLGFDISTDVFGRSAKVNITSLMLADVRNVVVISDKSTTDDDPSSKFKVPRLLDILCDPSIRKVGVSVERARALIKQRYNIDAQGFVELAPAKARSREDRYQRDPSFAALRALTSTHESIELPSAPQGFARSSNTMTMVKHLAARPFAALQVYSDRYGLDPGDFLDESRPVSDKPAITAEPSFGPLRLDAAPKFVMPKSFGFTDGPQDPSMVSRAQCILALAHDMTIDLFESLSQRPTKHAAFQAVDRNATAKAVLARSFKRSGRGSSPVAAKLMSLCLLEDLKAYCLATSLGEDIMYIDNCLGLVSPARTVLQVAERARLPLHEAHRVALTAAAAKEPPLVVKERARARDLRVHDAVSEEAMNDARSKPPKVVSQLQSVHDTAPSSTRSSTRRMRRRQKMTADLAAEGSEGQLHWVPFASSADGRSVKKSHRNLA